MAPESFAPRPPSLRSRATAATVARTLRPVTERVPDNLFGLAVGRGILAGGLAAFGSRAPSGSAFPVVVDRPDGEVRGEWVRARDVREDAVILYLHGSGYAACSARSHRGLVARLSAATGLFAFSLDYRLAPRHRFPAAADDVERAFGWLRERFPASQIVVAGDSAGGHLAIDLCLSLARKGDDLPAAVAVFSPLVDVTMGLARERESAIPDPLASATSGSRLVNHYIRDVDPAHPRLSHVFAEGEVLPPTLIQAGGAEMLAADAHALHDRLIQAGTYCELEVWPGQMHVFQAMPRLIPEANPALNRAAEFLQRHLANAASVAATTPEGLRA